MYLPFIVLTSFQGFFYFMSWCTSSCSHYGTPYSVHRPFSLWFCWCKFHHYQQIFTVFTGRHWSCDMRLTYKVCNSWHFTVHLKEAVPLTGCTRTLQLGVVLDFVFCIFFQDLKKVLSVLSGHPRRFSCWQWTFNPHLLKEQIRFRQVTCNFQLNHKLWQGWKVKFVCLIVVLRTSLNSKFLQTQILLFWKAMKGISPSKTKAARH